MVGADVQVAVGRLAAGHVGLLTGTVSAVLPPGDHQIVLAALPAEGERKQDLLAVSGDAHLVLAGDVPLVFGFQADVGGISLGQELV